MRELHDGFSKIISGIRFNNHLLPGFKKGLYKNTYLVSTNKIEVPIFFINYIVNKLKANSNEKY